MQHIVKCRICKQTFDTNKLPNDQWIMPSPKYYYHKNCYDNWRKDKDNIKSNIKDAEFWYESLIDYLYRDIKMSIDFQKLSSQWKSFTSESKNMTPKGIYFSIRYYYDVINGKQDKALGGIGIVPSIYRDAATYWTDLENKKSGTIDAIIEQIKAREARPVEKIIKKKEEKKTKTKWSLDSV